MRMPPILRHRPWDFLGLILGGSGGGCRNSPERLRRLADPQQRAAGRHEQRLHRARPVEQERDRPKREAEQEHPRSDEPRTLRLSQSILPALTSPVVRMVEDSKSVSGT
jgi:hypothetical protein